MYYMSNLSIRIPKEVDRELRRLCRAQRRPVSDVVRESIRRYIAAEKFHQLRAITMPLAESQGFLMDEDVFKAVS